jgi:hypothetical protein
MPTFAVLSRQGGDGHRHRVGFAFLQPGGAATVAVDGVVV